MLSADRCGRDQYGRSGRERGQAAGVCGRRQQQQQQVQNLINTSFRDGHVVTVLVLLMRSIYLQPPRHSSSGRATVGRARVVPSAPRRRLPHGHWRGWRRCRCGGRLVRRVRRHRPQHGPRACAGAYSSGIGIVAEARCLLTRGGLFANGAIAQALRVSMEEERARQEAAQKRAAEEAKQQEEAAAPADAKPASPKTGVRPCI